MNELSYYLFVVSVLLESSIHMLLVWKEQLNARANVKSNIYNHVLLTILKKVSKFIHV